ncbi:class I tRNA ligase family protein [Candidatus Nasuia deltocephalinicola]|nr:class I tRNA ligase family protein [Candidatus Nasuia deltocephalinicola]
MIPYPSGKIHIGHSRNYIINDIFNRFFFLKNFYKSKMFMGWDSFGTPAENASLLNNVIPLKFLKSNIYQMKKQLLYCDFSINWNYNLNTYNFNYYYFNQFIFLKFLFYNHLYLSNKKINWDVCEKTVLSNEQVIKGKGWRSSCLVKKINVKTYYFNIKKYKYEIFNEINNLNWPLKIKIMQKNWIFVIKFLFYFKIFLNLKLFKISSFSSSFFQFLFNIFNFLIKEKNIFLNIFILKNNFIINYFLKNIFNEKYYILKNFKKNYYYNFNKKFNIFFFFKNFKIFLFNIFIYLNLFEIFKIFKLKKFIFLKNFWNLKDWGVSRQKYWGCNIPTFFCKFCRINYSLNKRSIPFFISKNLQKNNLYYFKLINKIKCKFCKKYSFKEIFTMDTFVDSSWYFLKIFNKKSKINLKMPIDLYIGGVEHSILHLLYSRYFIKLLRDFKFLNFGEPFKSIFSQGMILYKNLNKILKMSKSSGNSIKPENIILSNNLDSLRFTLLKNSLNKDFLWNNNSVKTNFLFFNKLFFNNKIFKKKNIEKFLFLKKYFIIKNFKKLINFINKNLKKIEYFFKNLYFNNSLYFLIKLLKILKNYINLNYFSKFLFKGIFFKILIFFSFLFPYTSNNIFIFFKFYKFLKFNKIYFNKIFKVILKKKYFTIIFLLFKNKKLGFFFFDKLLKKKIYNFLFFKKNIFKKFLKKITFIKSFLNIF